MRPALWPDRLSLWQSNGPGAHQEIRHLHMHVIPGDQISPHDVDTPEDAIRASMAKDIRAHDD